MNDQSLAVRGSIAKAVTLNTQTKDIRSTVIETPTCVSTEVIVVLCASRIRPLYVLLSAQGEKTAEQQCTAFIGLLHDLKASLRGSQWATFRSRTFDESAGYHSSSPCGRCPSCYAPPSSKTQRVLFTDLARWSKAKAPHLIHHHKRLCLQRKHIKVWHPGHCKMNSASWSLHISHS